MHMSVDREAHQNIAWYLMRSEFNDTTALTPTSLLIDNATYLQFQSRAYQDDNPDGRETQTTATELQQAQAAAALPTTKSLTAKFSNWPLHKILKQRLGGITSLGTTDQIGPYHVNEFTFQLLHMDETLLKHMRHAIDESNERGQDYHDNLQFKKEVGECGPRHYTEARLFATNKLAARRDENWIHYNEPRASPAKICKAHPSITAFITAFKVANRDTIANIFGSINQNSSMAHWTKIYKEGRLFTDISVQAYAAQANPSFHTDGCSNILALSITLGTIHRQFIAQVGKTTTDLHAATIGAGTAYLASPCLFRHGTWSPSIAADAKKGGWQGTTLAIHFRHLVTKDEQRIQEDSVHTRGWSDLLNEIQDSIKMGKFRLPCMREAHVLQIKTLTTEFTPPMSERPQKKKQPKKKQAKNKRPAPPTHA
jgi:hypothetical protein